jgi:ribosomal protein S18 acetylase RimI-like enzyme
MSENDVLVEADLAALAPRATANLVALFTAMSALEGGEIERGGSVGRHHTFPTNPMFKGAWSTRLDGDVDDAIDETIGWFRARNAPYFFWWTDNDTQPTDLGERLEARGFLSMEGQQKALAHGIVQTGAGAPVMAMHLADADGGLLSRVPPGFAIVEVANVRALDDFRDVFVETYQIPEWAGQAWIEATKAIGIGRTAWRMFVGYLEGEPVATNMLVNGGGVASVYAVATLPRAQRKGIGAAMTLKPLLEARDEGFRHAVLFSSEEGYSVYRRLGFVDTGARINRYMWRAE